MSQEASHKSREKFEKTMIALFRVPKDAVKKPEKPAPKKNGPPNS